MPFPLALIPLAISAASAVYQGIKGHKQKKEAERLQADADARDAANLSDARRMALSGLPEAEYQRQLQAINRNEALALSALKDRRSALAGTTNIQQSTNDALMDLAAKDAMARTQNQKIALGQADRQSGKKDQQAAYARESANALSGAAMQNIFNSAGYGAMALGGAFGNGTASNSYYGPNGPYAGMKPLDTSLYGKGGYNGGLDYAKPY